MSEYRFCPLCGSALEIKFTGGGERSACPSGSCGFIFWDNPIPVAAAIIEYEGNALLARNSSWPEKMFGPVAGFIEKGESPDEAAKREVMEEIGLETDQIELIGIYPLKEKNQIVAAYYLKCSGTIKLNEEIAETKQIPFEKLKPWPFGTGLAVKDLLIKKGLLNRE